ncbi:hypothetical protein [Paenibacillus piri]|uniref:Alginate lyase domain-containing protein n=1 Tax=Paenibacillus piri TaxID=2547395 RepID=A0A4V2ZSE5_9BACL|nr:hypothetical protein [Paenibacillus piri]TDF92814.1 hypothetical protein E1757_29345 [Paenibacillus piri]
MLKGHYRKIIEITELYVPFILRFQCLDTSSRDYGGCVVPPKEFSEPGVTAHCLDVLLSVYYNADSIYCGKPELLNSARLYIASLLREQHEDGTQDLKETNFHDATSAAFTVQVLAYTYRLVQKYSKQSELEQEIGGMMFDYLSRAAEGILNGGFHTPNHRWVMASALSLLYNLLGDERLRTEIQLYLNEGIDCDEYGEYTERSVGIYNVINNRSLQIMAEQLAMPELLQHIQRNLDMVMKYIEPDQTLFTLNSTRQDYGKDTYPISYYDNFLLMAYQLSNKTYAYVADQLLHLTDRLLKKADSAVDIAAAVPAPRLLTQYMLNEGLDRFESETEAPGLHYETWFKNSGVIRQRTDNVTLTVLKNNSTFLKFQSGGNKVYVKFAGSFFSKGQFKVNDIQKTDKGYSLNYSCEWGYVRPFPNGSPTPVWGEMKHAERERVQLQRYDITIDIIIEREGIVMDVHSEGVEQVPCKLEFIFESGGMLETGDTLIPGDAGRTAILKNGEAIYRLDGESIRLQGGFGEHAYTSAMRGTEANSKDKFTVYMTDFTPVRRQVSIYAGS